MDALGGEGPDAVLIRSEVNVSYLTGFSGDSSSLLLTRDRALLVSDDTSNAIWRVSYTGK